MRAAFASQRWDGREDGNGQRLGEAHVGRGNDRRDDTCGLEETETCCYVVYTVEVDTYLIHAHASSHCDPSPAWLSEGVQLPGNGAPAAIWFLLGFLGRACALRGRHTWDGMRDRVPGVGERWTSILEIGMRLAAQVDPPSSISKSFEANSAKACSNFQRSSEGNLFSSVHDNN